MHQPTFTEKFKHVVLGQPLSNERLEEEKLSWFWGLPIMSSDAVSSVAYAIEEILLVLVPVLGALAINYVGIVAAPIILLLIVLAFSYAQIINHYPHGGGAYNVASDNFGKKPSLVAASSLVVDYVLTVAVSISSATAAFTAALPQFAPFRVPIAIACVIFVTVINLRGSRESSKIFGIPTYAFILIMGSMIITGLIELASGHLSPLHYSNVPAPSIVPGFDFIFILLLLRAFSSGCSALTGIEAVSNSMPSFKKPSQKNAKIVLYCLAGIILFIFGGSVVLAQSLKVMPLEGSTVIAQMGQAVFGRGFLFYFLQFTTALILLLAANTAYTDLPNLLSILARDGYMPRQFTQRGTKLSLSNGILFILVAASALIIFFGAQTHRLIPLYSVGVFLSFTISQSGMVVKWVRDKERHWQTKMIINVVGSIMTGVGLVIVFLMKFSHGAWMLAIVIPALSYMMWRIHSHYTHVGKELQISKKEFEAHYHRSTTADTFLCVVLAGGMNRATLKALNYANIMSSNVVAVHISSDPEAGKRLRKQWDDYDIDVPLEIIQNPYRDLTTQLENYVDDEVKNLRSGNLIAVILIKYVVEHWYDSALHNQTTNLIMRKLRSYRDVSTVLVPYHYSHTHDHLSPPIVVDEEGDTGDVLPEASTEESGVAAKTHEGIDSNGDKPSESAPRSISE